MNNGDAYRVLENLRWAGHPVCPHCGSTAKHYFLKPSNGKSRRTTRGGASERRVWKCSRCRGQFTVITGTLMHNTKVPITIWLSVITEMLGGKCRTLRDMHAEYGISIRAARRLRRSVEAMMTADEKNPDAVSLGRRGGLKGGPARAAAMSPEERSDAARNAAETRWGSLPPGRVLPTGTYRLRVTDCAINSGTLRPTYRVIGGEHSGELVALGHITLNDASKALFFRTMKCFGLDRDYFTAENRSMQEIADKLVGRTIKADVIQRTYDGRLTRNTFASVCSFKLLG